MYRKSTGNIKFGHKFTQICKLMLQSQVSDWLLRRSLLIKSSPMVSVFVTPIIWHALTRSITTISLFSSNGLRTICMLTSTMTRYFTWYILPCTTMSSEEIDYNISYVLHHATLCVTFQLSRKWPNLCLSYTTCKNIYKKATLIQHKHYTL